MTNTASNNFEGGTDGVAVSTANSGGGSGTAFDSIFGTGLTFKSAAALHGTMGARVTAGSFGAGVYTTSSTKASGKMYFRPAGVTTGDLFVARVENGSGTRLFSLHINAAGKLRVDDASGTTGVFTFSNVLSGGTKYWYQYYIVAGTATNNGTIKVQYGVDGSQTPAETQYFNNGGANVGAGQTIGKVYFGPTGSSGTVDIDIDDIQFDNTLTDIIGWPAATPPTVSITANQNVANSASVTASVTASSSSSTIASYAWSVIYSSAATPTLTGASTSSVSFTATSDSTKGHLYILQCIVTDAASQSTTVTTEVRVPTGGDATTLPGAWSTAVGTWANVGGAATSGEALADSLDSTYLESTNLSSSAVSVRQRLAPMLSKNPFSLSQRFQTDVSASNTVKFRLYEGTTLRQEWTQTVTNAWAQYDFSVTTPGAISDWGNLYLEAYVTSP